VVGLVVVALVVVALVLAGLVVVALVVAGLVLAALDVVAPVVAGLTVDGLARAGVDAGAGSVRAGDVGVAGEPKESGWRPVGIASAAVLGSGAGGSAAAAGTSAKAQIRASGALQRCLALPRPRRSDSAQMLTQFPPSLAVCCEKARCRDPVVNLLPSTE
jgi:hypothetical protein